MKTISQIIKLAVAILFVLLLSACATATTEVPEVTTAPEEPAETEVVAPTEEVSEPTQEVVPSTEEVVEPEEEIVLRIATPNTVSTLDPIKSAAAGDIEVFGQLYSRLLKSNPEGTELGPGLAERWESSPDETVWTFYLRDDLKFSDGSTLTAEDVVFSFLRLRDSESSVYSGPFQPIKDVVAVDNMTVQFTLNGPSAPFFGSVEMFNAGIVSKAAIEADEEGFAQMPVTSGPYKVREWLPNDRLVLERNAYYWREGYPKIDVVEFLEVPNDNTRVSMIKTGEVEVAVGVPYANIAELDTSEEIDVPLDPSTVIEVMLLNHKDTLISDVRVRKAVAHALDIEGITEAVTFGLATPANSPIPNALLYYDPDLPPIGYDPDEAKRLLEETGQVGVEFKLMLVSGSATAEQFTLLAQDQLNQVGFNATVEQVDLGTWWDKLVSGDYQAAITWWYNETPDPDLAVRWALCGACGSDSFYTFYNNEEINRLTDEAVKEIDKTKRGELYSQIQKIALDEVAQVPFYYPPYTNAYRTTVQGLMMNPALQFSLEEATLSR